MLCLEGGRDVRDLRPRLSSTVDLCPVLNLPLEAQAGEGAWQWLIAHIVISMAHFSGAETALWSHMCSFDSSRWIVWRVLWRSHYNRSFLPTSRSPSSWTSPVAPEVGVLHFLSHWSEEPPSNRPTQGCLLVRHGSFYSGWLCAAQV